MSTKDSWIKYCPKCNSMINFNNDICEFCGHEFVDYKLTKEEQLISFDNLTEEIDKAFYKLEGFMSGHFKNYQGFDFIHSFDMLFTKAKQDQNYSYRNTQLILSYFKLIGQIAYDTDKGKFKNRDAYKNKQFEEDVNSLDYLFDRLDYKFLYFVSNDEIQSAEKGFSIEDILRQRADIAPTKKLSLNDPATLHIEFSSPEILEKVFDLLKSYFPNSESELFKALSGELLEYPIYFNHSQNKLVEVFRRFHYNGFIISTLTGIKVWLCKNFTFLYTKGTFKEQRNFNEETVRQQLVTGKGDPSAKSRICVVDWLPYKEPLSRKSRNS